MLFFKDFLTVHNITKIPRALVFLLFFLINIIRNCFKRIALNGCSRKDKLCVESRFWHWRQSRDPFTHFSWKPFNYFHKKLYLKWSAGSWNRFWVYILFKSLTCFMFLDCEAVIDIIRHFSRQILCKTTWKVP